MQGLKEKVSPANKAADVIGFVDLVTQCLDLDPECRITAAEARTHAWITEELGQFERG